MQNSKISSNHSSSVSSLTSSHHDSTSDNQRIYKLPTPPPEIKRVFHRIRSPEPKIIERIFVCRPTSEIIENIIEIPPRKVHIINREKHFRQSKPITRTKVVHLKRCHRHENEE
ncbi:unnamed protein product [Rotaria sp. Silwood2]|nr:unnamed protein product [Rotaria sp. Silwood2]CAF4233862.1 unnamed protein product [Rotaria sp. Silwood2]